jgi:hypothetical protein
MYGKIKLLWVMAVMVALALIAAQCVVPTPITVVETVVVEKEGETIVETVEVVETVIVEVPVEAPTEIARSPRGTGSLHRVYRGLQRVPG